MRTYGNFNDFVDFSRSSGGTALRPISYGPELVTNGTFDSDSDWTKGTGWAIAGGLATHSGTSTGNIIQSGVLQAGKIYTLNYELSGDPSDGVFVYADIGNLSNQVDYELTTGIKTVTFIATGDSLTFRTRGNTGCSIDNISVREVLFDQAGAPLTLFNHPADIPRIEYNADGERLGLLVEEARTNLRTYSQDFTNAAYQKNSVSITANTIVAPDGTLTGSKMVESATSAWHYGGGSNTVSAETTYTYSIYAKAGERDTCFINFPDDTKLSKFNLSTGSVISEATNVTATIEDAGNGWYRLICTHTTASGDTAIGPFFGLGTASYTGDGTSGIYIWGAQLEAGSFPTSYIPTSGATATRAADVCSIPVSAFGYNQAEGTVVASYYAFSGQGSTTRIMALSDGSTSNSIQMALLDAGTTYHEVRNGGSAVVTTVIAGAITNDALSKTAVASSKDDYAGVTNGGTVGTDASGAMPVGITTLNIGSHFIGNFPLNGHIKSIQYIPRRLTNAQLVELTS